MNHILLFERDKEVLHTVEYLLKKMGHSVHGFSAVNDFDVLERKLRRLKPRLVICDLDVTAIGGADICKYIKAHKLFGKTPVLLSSKTQPDQMYLEMCGSNGFIKKPYDIHRFEDTIHKYLAAWH